MTNIRPDVSKLPQPWSDPLLWYAKAIRTMQSRPITDPTSWRFLAAMHGIDPTVWTTFGYLDENEALPPAAVQDRYWAQCQHQSWYFLPWHRGYLAAFESVVRAAVVTNGGPADWSLPYWNYSDSSNANARQLPQAFEAETLPDGTPNPLRVQRRYGNGQEPITVRSQDVLLTALRDDRFPGGEDDIPPGFGGPVTGFHHGGEDQAANGGLESVPHNQVHGSVGGSKPGADPNNWRNWGLMSTPITAGLDPIFWLHHSNIDRLWSIWLKVKHHHNPTARKWTAGPTDRAFVMPKAGGGEWVFKPADVIKTTVPALNYRYEDESVPPHKTRKARRLSNLGAPAHAIALAEAATETDMPDRSRVELIGATEAPVQVSGETETAVKVDPRASAKVRQNFLTAEAAPEGAEPDRVFLKLEGIKGTSDASNYDVYIDVPEGEDPAKHPDRYVGTVSLFGVSSASRPDGPHAGNGLAQVFEISELADRLHLAGDSLDKLNVRFVPANPTVAKANFSVGRVSLYRMGA